MIAKEILSFSTQPKNCLSLFFFALKFCLCGNLPNALDTP